MASFFPGAKNIVISGGTFTSVNSPSNSIRFGMDRLLQNISQGAFHNAAERGTPPRCHPHTRTAIRAEIMEWIRAPSSMRKLILWMYGPAGAGKTAIAQSIAEECEQQGLIAASFFFWRTAAGRNDASKFVATLAYQLSRYVPQLEDPILTAIEQDPAIFSRSVSTQMHSLVIAPLKSVRPSLSTPLFVIVDGFDECGPDGQAQSDLLHILGTVALELQEIPLIFLITSRPEYEIREAFNGDFLNPLIKVLVLDNSYKPDEDIKIYFESTFQKIYEEHSRLRRRLPSPWPTANDIDSLVSKASGQFIFAATVLKFVNSPRHNPADRLDTVLRLSHGGKETPFTLLDAFYRFILDSVVDVDSVLEILTLLLLAKEFGRTMSLQEAEDLLGLEFHSALLDMHSLLLVPAPTEDELPSLHHASLGDFLMDRSRSGNYYIDARHGHASLCRRWLKVIGADPQSRTMRNEFAVDGFIHSYRNCTVGQDILDDLACLDLKTSLEGISSLSKDLHDPDWDKFFACIKEQAGDRSDIFPRLQNDFDAFIFNRIEQYPLPLRVHMPILLCRHSHGCAIYMFKVLLRGESASEEEADKWQRLDGRLLSISTAFMRSELVNPYFGNLLQDKSRAGESFVDSSSYTALASSIAGIIYTRPGEWNHGQLSPRDIGSDDIYGSWFAEILETASTDLDLANFLNERAIQFRKDLPGLKVIAQASVKYIQRSGIPFLEHVHQPDMDQCGICLWCSGASIVELTQKPISDPICDPASPP